MTIENFTISTLGPQGTFSHQAALKVIEYLQPLEISKELSFEKSISRVFRAADNEIDLAVIPLENSTAGSIGTSMDSIIEYNRQGMQIIAEIDLEIAHYLTGHGDLSQVTTIYAHPQAYAQCDLFIDNKLNAVDVIYTTSNAESAKKVQESNSPAIAAIVPQICLDLYGIPMLAENIHNSSLNSTRFIVVSSKEYVIQHFNSRVKSKSTLLIDPRDDRPGLLNEILQIFAAKLINLTKIESRPSKRRLGDYVFYLDIQADISHPILQDCLIELQKTAQIRNLGSYNRIV
ncbi:Prephenate dehydratase [Candidatus Lokiarchaeum ossiferum]|uniref:prephenate dehydratase n=1 Tax=Candidatus Lokiarchaeum ossiferum TaxID=2951803 RepID=A0ABY6HTP9_9ARCH|nr:Prephenate dehydratase [Candidatus Lokiarchaeum sp. B-35]